MGGIQGIFDYFISFCVGLFGYVFSIFPWFSIKNWKCFAIKESKIGIKHE